MSTTQVGRLVAVGCVAFVPLSGAAALAQISSAPASEPGNPAAMTRATTPPTPPAASANRVVPPSGYVIGPDDVLGIVFWREKDLSAEVVVRPDGIITLPLLDDIKVTGMTPAELKQKVTAEASKLVTNPTVSVIVKQINSRKVFITGHVARPGPYPLTAPMSVVQLIALAGGLLEFADRSKIRVMRVDRLSGAETYLVNYKQLANGEDLKQNIELKPGDTVIVP
jgi:polysaccharide export outer membrane protein